VLRPLLYVLLCAAVFVAPASARPDGPLEVYLEYEASQLVLEMPAVGTLTDGFGPRWGRLHAGIDVGILKSLDVRAAAAGSVTQVGWLSGYSGYGQVVLVDVGNGYRTMYAHLSRIDVKPGDWVVVGQRLGLAGCTGSCTGTHLHFELHERGRAVDPMPFVAR
jgi:murein DD-endopeptidase MepM/ murein hydrolase activator NlpD